LGNIPPPQANPAYAADPTIGADTVSKFFGQKVAVSSVSVSFGPGITGLLGPNGAGKTTLLRMLAGLLVPSEGNINVLGQDPRKDHSVYRNVGLVPEESAIYPSMTGREYVEYAAKLSGFKRPHLAASRALDEVSLGPDADRSLGGYSKGMRQRAKVAAALVHEPAVLILDEPLNGTDPVQRAHLISAFKRLAAAGHTVIVSSHVLQEVERMASRVIAMVDGRLAAAGDIQAIRGAMSDIPYRVTVSAEPARPLARELMGQESVDGVTIDGTTMSIQTNDLPALGVAIPALASQLDVRVTGFSPDDESLESVFRYLVVGR
jgi:ABC-2 type transport system ATP-binding protein